MSTSISVLPEEGKFVHVTDGEVTVYAAWHTGHWRDVLADGGWLEFSDAATWSNEPPVATAVVEPEPAPVAPAA